MIAINYAKNILNFLFATDGAAGVTPEEELAQLEAEGIPEKITGEQMKEATILPGEENDNAIILKKDKIAKTYQSYRDRIEETEWFLTETDIDTAYTHTYVKNGQSIDKVIYGWKRVPSDVQRPKFPAARYLALFTRMPDENGKNYVEPFHNNGTPTTYRRINLDKGYFTGASVLDPAILDPENGGAVVANKSTIYYPEILGVDWTCDSSPNIVGFGVFSHELPIDGAIPFLWGSLNNDDPVTATKNHVPLFRVGEFRVSIS